MRTSAGGARKIGPGSSTEGSSTRSSGSRDGDGWLWRGMFERLDLPAAWPVYVSQAEASVYARWRDGRLPTEAEFHRAAYGVPDGEGSSSSLGRRGADAETRRVRLRQLGSRAGRQPPGGPERLGLRRSHRQWLDVDVHGVRAVPGFSALASYPEYSADFFDGEHFVMKGASPATAKSSSGRRSATGSGRDTRVVYATFRVVEDRAPGGTYAMGAALAHASVQPRESDRTAEFAADVRAYLERWPRQLPSRYLYDRLGSALFDAIRELPWYHVTRAEQRFARRARRHGARSRQVHQSASWSSARETARSSPRSSRADCRHRTGSNCTSWTFQRLRS